MCVSCVNVYQSVFAYIPFGFEGRMWDLILLDPGHCFSVYFIVCVLNRLSVSDAKRKPMVCEYVAPNTGIIEEVWFM